MENKLMLGFLMISLVGLVFLSGCISQEAEATCGNGKVEAGEECDSSGCLVGQTCEDCKCVSPKSSGDVASPPAIPA